MESKIALRYAATLGLVALLAALAFWNIRSLTLLQDEAAAVVDLSVNQLALVQRIAAEAVRLDASTDLEESGRLAEALRRDAGFLRNSHEILAGDGPNLPEDFRYSGPLRAIYRKAPLHLDRQVQLFLQNVNEVLEEGAPARRKSLVRNLSEAAAGPLAEGLRAAARQYRGETLRRADLLLSLGLGVLAVTWGLLLYDAFLVFRPLMLRIAVARQEAAEQSRRAEEASQNDRLTGLNSRFKLAETLEREIATAQRYGTPLSLLLVDVDHFAEINKTYGLETGDRLLSELALLVRNNLRLSDHAFRFDGTSFAVITPQTSTEGAAALGDKLRRLVRGYSFGSSPLTVSMSVAGLDGRETRESLLERAEQALQRAKDKGRDRLETA